MYYKNFLFFLRVQRYILFLSLQSFFTLFFHMIRCAKKYLRKKTRAETALSDRVENTIKHNILKTSHLQNAMHSTDFSADKTLSPFTCLRSAAKKNKFFYSKKKL